jgi:hypothetical protein
MIRQSRIINASARAGGSKIAPALGGLERVSKVARESARMARAAASIALLGNSRWKVPAEGSLLKDKPVFEAGSYPGRGAARDSSRSSSASELGRSETDNRSTTARGGSGWNRATTMVNAGARASREIQELSRAMNALSRVQRSVDLGKTTSDSRKDATAMMATDARGRGRSHEAMQPPFVDAGVLANVRVAPSIRGAMPPTGISQREFARPSRDLGASTGGNGRSAITINSSPTVVINAAVGGAVQQDVMGALRAHREEIFDQLKREPARRERAQF